MIQRTCDALGVCQHRTTPCAGGSNTHPAYHHLHRVHHNSPAATRACTADQCQQGRTPCPCPQACELPTDPLQDERMSAAEGVLLVLLATLVAAIFIMAVLASAA